METQCYTCFLLKNVVKYNSQNMRIEKKGK